MTLITCRHDIDMSNKLFYLNLKRQCISSIDDVTILIKENVINKKKMYCTIRVIIGDIENDETR